jgi:hypothetical protein
VAAPIFLLDPTFAYAVKWHDPAPEKFSNRGRQGALSPVASILSPGFRVLYAVNRLGAGSWRRMRLIVSSNRRAFDAFGPTGPGRATKASFVNAVT